MKNEDQPMGSRDDLIRTSIGFLHEVKDMTPGAEMEKWLNEKYGEESQLYRNLARMISAGVAEGWAANLEINGRNYRHSGILEAAPDPGRRHYPEVRGGAVIALFYLPAGRISYDFPAPA